MKPHLSVDPWRFFSCGLTQTISGVRVLLWTKFLRWSHSHLWCLVRFQLEQKRWVDHMLIIIQQASLAFSNSCGLRVSKRCKQASPMWKYFQRFCFRLMFQYPIGQIKSQGQQRVSIELYLQRACLEGEVQVAAFFFFFPSIY